MFNHIAMTIIRNEINKKYGKQYLNEDLKSNIKKDTVIEAHSIRTDFENDIRYNIVYKYDTIDISQKER